MSQRFVCKPSSAHQPTLLRLIALRTQAIDSGKAKYPKNIKIRDFLSSNLLNKQRWSALFTTKKNLKKKNKLINIPMIPPTVDVHLTPLARNSHVYSRTVVLRKHYSMLPPIVQCKFDWVTTTAVVNGGPQPPKKTLCFLGFQ